MNATALNRSSATQQPEKPSKISANKVQGDGTENALFSGMLQQCLDQNQASRNLKAAEEPKGLADGSLSAIEAKLSASMNLGAQSGSQVEASATQSAELIGQVQKNVGTTATPSTERNASALSGPDLVLEPTNQNPPHTAGQHQMILSAEPKIAGNASVKVNQAEMTTASLGVSGHPHSAEDGALTEVFKTMEGLSEGTVQDSSLLSKLSKSQELVSQSRLSTVMESRQNENAALNPAPNAIESTDTPKDQMNPEHRSEAAAADFTTVEGLKSQKATPSKQSSDSFRSVSDGVGGQPQQISSLDDASFNTQIPKAATIRELPAILTQQAQLLRAGETKTLRMMLNPEHLGALEIELSLKNGVLSGIVSVETELAHDLIQKNLPQLLSTFDSRQIASGSFEMHYRGEHSGFSESSGNEAQPDRHRQSGSAERSDAEQGLVISQEIAIQKVNPKRIDLLA